MIKRSTLLHLRIPFSFFLLPIFLFALLVSPAQPLYLSLLLFIIIHLFLYPASNGYNSYFDKDEDSIGLLKKPPAVHKDLYYTTILLDLIAVIVGFVINWELGLMLLIYGLVSKAYSHPWIRLKKYAITSWLVAGFFQGFFTFLMVYIALNNASVADLSQFRILFPAGLSMVFLLGSYPMTQVYQHREDQKRGDQTISLKLGILGTFHLTALVFTLSMAGFVWYFYQFYSDQLAIMFLLFTLPILIFFIFWYFKTRRDRGQANFDNTMKLNFISASCLNLFFILAILRF